MRQPYTKRALSYSEQLERLRQRGLAITDAASAESELANLNYYRLAAYWLPFEADHATHLFMPGASFERVVALYVFDRELRLLALDALERVEVAVRARWAYALAHEHGPHAHLKPELHSRTVGAFESNLVRLRDEVVRARGRELFIDHLLSTYREPLPAIWACCEVMSLGTLSRWYDSLADNRLRGAIAKPFGLHHKVLVSWLRHLTIVRNVCAHHARLWNREFTVTPAAPKSTKDGLESRWVHGSRQLFNTLLILLHLMDVIAPNHTWRTRLRVHLATVDAPGGLEAMGFPVHMRPGDM